jgi:hypothetical protein
MAGTISGFQLPRRRNSTLKKIFAIVLAALFVLSFAASAFAIHAEIPSETQAVVGAGTTQITLGGELRVRGWYTDNVFPILGDLNFLNLFGGGGVTGLPLDAPSSAWYDERVRLSLDAKVSPNVEGMVQLETSNTNTENLNGPHADSYTWGNFDNKPDTLSILQAWIMYSGSGLLGVPAGIKIGHMPLALGQSTFFDHTKYGDDAIVLFALPTKELEVDLLSIKFAGDGNGLILPTFGIDTTDFPGGVQVFDAFGSRFHNNADLDGYVGIVTYKIDDKNTIGVNYTYLNLPDLKFKHQNLEVTGNGNISGLGYKFAGDIQFGSVDALNADFKGWAAMVGLNYQLDPVNLRASFGYGTGPENSNDIKEFVNYLGDDQHYTFVYEYNVMAASGRMNSGLDNTNYYNIGVDVNPVKDLKASLDGYLLRATKTETFGPGVSKSVGWELDAKVAYDIAKNLTYEVDGGYMHAGNFYKDIFGSDIVKNPIVLMHKLTLSF